MNSSENRPKKLINSRTEIIEIVDSFYSKVRHDLLIGPIFNDVAKVDWPEHLPKLYNFWEDLLFGTQNYHGRPFPPHIPLDLKIEHFERWLGLFVATIEESFYGQKADEMKNRALRIAQNFLNNLNWLSTQSST